MLFGFQKELIKHNKVVMCAPRQIGKTHGICVRQALDSHDVIITSNDKENAKKILRQYQQITGLEGLQMTSSNFLGRRVEVLSSKPESVPGRTASVIIDEFGLHQQQAELLQAAQPVQTRTGRIQIISTPRNRSSLFYDLLFGESGRDGNFKVFYYTVYDLLEDYKEQLKEVIKDDEDKDQSVIRYLKQTQMTESAWKREYECQFDSDNSVLIGYDMQKSVHLGKTREQPALDSLSNLQFGIDIGRSSDRTVIYVCGEEKERNKLVCVELENFTGKAFSEQKELISRYIKRYSPYKVFVDATGLGLNLSEDLFREHGSTVIPVTFGKSQNDLQLQGMDRGRRAIPKSFLAENLKHLVETKKVEIYSDNDIAGSMNSITKTYTRFGDYIVYEGSFKDTHCDDFWQLSLAVHNISGYSLPSSLA